MNPHRVFSPPDRGQIWIAVVLAVVAVLLTYAATAAGVYSVATIPLLLLPALLPVLSRARPASWPTPAVPVVRREEPHAVGTRRWPEVAAAISLLAMTALETARFFFDRGFDAPLHGLVRIGALDSLWIVGAVGLFLRRAWVFPVVVTGVLFALVQPFLTMLSVGVDHVTPPGDRTTGITFLSVYGLLELLVAIASAVFTAKVVRSVAPRGDEDGTMDASRPAPSTQRSTGLR